MSSLGCLAPPQPFLKHLTLKHFGSQLLATFPFTPDQVAATPLCRILDSTNFIFVIWICLNWLARICVVESPLQECVECLAAGKGFATNRRELHVCHMGIGGLLYRVL